MAINRKTITAIELKELLGDRHNAYWAERSIETENALANASIDFAENLKKQYKDAYARMNQDLASWYLRFMESEGIDYATAKQRLNSDELYDWKMSVEEYIKKGKTLNYSDQWAKQLESASARVHITRLEALQLQMQQQVEAAHAWEKEHLWDFLKGQYEESYFKNAWSTQTGLNVAWDMAGLDTDRINKVLSTPWASDGKNFSSRIWSDKEKLVRDLGDSLSQGIIAGDSYKEISESLAGKMTGKYKMSNIDRLVSTESAYFASEGQKDCFNDLGVERYEIVATLDNLTSKICQKMDGKVFEMKDFISGKTAPPFHPRCRSCTCPYFDDEFTEGELRAARDLESGDLYYVPSNMPYPEWKESFVNNGSKAGYDGVKDGIILSELKSIGVKGEINLPPRAVNLENTIFDDEHINMERKRNITLIDAKQFINESKISVTVWDGQYERFYGENGAVYFDLKRNLIRTAFKSNEFGDEIKGILEVLKKHGR